MLKYDIANPREYRLNKPAIRKCVLAFTRVTKIRNKYFSLAFVDGSTIRKWNRIYRGHDQVTDVLSFAARDEKFIGLGENKELGEILICLPQAKRQAKDCGWSFDQELERLLIHGLAHLIGYEHEGVSRKTAAKMRRFEEGVWRQR